MPQAHGITTNQGDFNLAGRDITIQNYYRAYPDRVDISAVLGAIRNLRTIHLDILSRATPGTGTWLLKTDKFIIWLDPNGDLKILWGTGIPGAGKTVLASIVIRELEALIAIEGSRICVCYVYIRYSDRADLSVRNIMAILVKQTVERHPECAAIAEKAYARHLRERTQPTEAELLQLLHRFTQVNAATFYLLDALDEAPDRIQVDLVLKFASLNVRLFITSRPLEAVQARVSNAHCFPIVAQEGDLDLHINQEIARSRDFADFLENADGSLRGEIVSLVKSKCGGMFLHAALQLQALCECVTALEVRQTLEDFPLRIQDIYLQTWNRIVEQKSSHVLLAKAALVWVLHSSRSMTIEELQRAVATSPETYTFEPNRLAPGTILIALCRGLVILEEESRLVRLIHYTAKDTLQELLHDSYPHPHSHLATVCITHLTQRGFQNTTIRSEEEFIAARQADPLLAYASDAWAVHARASLDVEDTRRRIASFISEIHAFPAFTGPDLIDCFDILKPLHVLAMYHLPISLIAHGKICGLNAETEIYRDSPFTLASWHGHEGAVASFLTYPGLLVNLVNRDGWSAIMAAAHCSHEGTVRILLARPGIQANHVGGEGSSAQVQATCEGYEGSNTPLFKHPEIQINLVNNRAHSALILAASIGHKGIVKLLLARPEIQVNMLDHDESSALMKAANEGHKGVVQLLLAHPEIHVNLVDYEEWSALMLAACHGREAVVKLLIERPSIQVNLVSNSGCSALMLAAYNGYDGTVNALLEHSDIQLNLVSTQGCSALMLAADKGHEGIIKLFLGRPEIQINLASNTEWSALMLASSNGHEAVVKLLLQRTETQFNSVEHEGLSALMLAAKWGHESIVRLLLDVPHINTTTKSHDGRTAMSIALAEGHTGVVQLLQQFQDRCEVRSESESRGPATVVDFDREEEAEPVHEGGRGQSESDDSDYYEDAAEWLEWTDDQ
ncbi:ankyrin repeat-containing domain protein [Coprinopsis sp. MPI-PUGE-AT-0042]|nr:ankyrin repeat-containing domain protein [Coprinopsis sp. MPI-PUGE-AT-0042]